VQCPRDIHPRVKCLGTAREGCRYGHKRLATAGDYIRGTLLCAAVQDFCGSFLEPYVEGWLGRICIRGSGSYRRTHIGPEEKPLGKRRPVAEGKECRATGGSRRHPDG